MPALVLIKIFQTALQKLQKLDRFEGYKNIYAQKELPSF
jgi:hypothetical protein